MTLAAGVISAVGGMGVNERKTIIEVCKNGEDYLQSLEYIFDDNPHYQLIRVQLPFLEFIDDGFRIIQGKGTITGIKTSAGWLLP